MRYLPGRAVAVALLLVTAGCTSGSGTAAPSPTPAVTGDAGCGDTPIMTGGVPAWTKSANPPAFLRHVLSREQNLIGMLFADPLRVPSPPGGPNNKILWIVREPRNGQPLELTLTPTGAGAPVSVTEVADSSPGEIYPSIVDVPTPGCWSVRAEWDGHTATLALPYQAG